MSQVKIKKVGTSTAFFVDDNIMELMNLKLGDVAEMLIDNYSIVIFPLNQKSRVSNNLNNSKYRKKNLKSEQINHISGRNDLVSHIKSLRGKYKDKLSSSVDFANKKKDEVLIEG